MKLEDIGCNSQSQRLIVAPGEMFPLIINLFSWWETSVLIPIVLLIVRTSSVLLGLTNILSNWRRYTRAELFSEVLDYQSKHYNTTDFHLKHNISALVFTRPYLLQRTRLVDYTKERVCSLCSRRINN